MLNNDTKFENPRLKVRKLQKLGFRVLWEVKLTFYKKFGWS